MDFKTKQKQYDDMKWYDSIWAGEDKCGSYEYCGNCRKDEKYPCARAAHRYYNGYIRLAIVRRQK